MEEEWVMMRDIDIDYRICPECNRKVDRNDMDFSRDYHGITFRLLCWDCLQKIYETKGYDGEKYSELDECLDDDY